MLHYEVLPKLLSRFYSPTEQFTLVEIGVAQGFMERLVLQYFKNAKIYGIDLTANPFTIEQQKKITYIRKNSDFAFEEFSDGSIDFLYIDGDHSYEQCKKDICNWRKKIKKNGIIAGHDYCKTYPGVVKAVNEEFSSFNREEDSVWWVML